MMYTNAKFSTIALVLLACQIQGKPTTSVETVSSTAQNMTGGT